MAELSSKRAADLGAVAKHIKSTSDTLERAIIKGWDQFSSALERLETRRTEPSQGFTVSGFLIDVGLACLIGPVAGAVRDAAIDQQARTFEAMLWVLWFMEVTGKQLSLDAKGNVLRSGTSASAAIGTFGLGKPIWNVERKFVDYWMSNLIDPRDPRGRSFLDRYKGDLQELEDDMARSPPSTGAEAGLRQAVDTRVRHQAENDLQLYFFDLEREIVRANMSGEKLLAIISRS